MPKKISVFVTYAWESDEHTSRVVAFTNMLRQNGLDAELDRSITQQGTAINFNEMMEVKMRTSDKVVVVLSEAYREKAESFAGGVGKEYRIITQSIDEEPSKYILVSFAPQLSKRTLAKIAPPEFRDRDIVNLYKDQLKDFRQLFSKLFDQPDFIFDEVKNEMPSFKAKPIDVFDLRQRKKTQNKPFEEPRELLQSFVNQVVQNSYFETYHSSIVCSYAIVNGILAIRKKVKTKLVLINPQSDFIEEAKFFTPYRFSRIDGIEDYQLLELDKLKIKIDKNRKISIKNEIIINENAGDSRVYDDAVKLQYRQVKNQRNKELSILFENRLEIDLEETRIVPRNDTIYLKRINKLTRNFHLDYQFPDFDGHLTGNCFSSLASREKIDYPYSNDNKRVVIRSKDWLLPGDGIFILAKRNNYLP